MEYITFDAHKHYTLASVARPDGRLVREQRIPHERGALQQFLERCERGSPVAVETIGNWYWIASAASVVIRSCGASRAASVDKAVAPGGKSPRHGRIDQGFESFTLPSLWL
jgi:hypothetical protein